jgi:hypothetical protein
MLRPFTKQEWIGYYSRKRIIQQWVQLSLLTSIDCKKILEIGPGLGLVTSLLINAGYEVHTLDQIPQMFDYPNVRHHEKNIYDLRADEIAGYDAILCCETLEHIEWERVGHVLSTFRESGAKYLIVSVPYMAFQIFLELYVSVNTIRQYFSLKKFLFLKDFAAEPPGGHQWEVGYKRFPLRVWETRLRDCGWTVIKRDFTEHCRSVFHVLQAR